MNKVRQRLPLGVHFYKLKGTPFSSLWLNNLPSNNVDVGSIDEIMINKSKNSQYPYKMMISRTIFTSGNVTNFITSVLCGTSITFLGIPVIAYGTVPPSMLITATILAYLGYSIHASEEKKDILFVKYKSEEEAKADVKYINDIKIDMVQYLHKRFGN
jgi:hypothetical protein